MWTNSTFCFESANYDILRAIKCANGVTHQVVRYVNILHHITLLENYVQNRISNEVENYCTDILKARLKKITRNEEVTFFGCGESLNSNLLEGLKQYRPVSKHAKMYYKLVKNGCLFKSYVILKDRSNNSCAMLANNKIIRIIGFIVDSECENLVAYNVIKTKDINNNHKFIKIIENIENNVTFAPLSRLQTVCALIIVNNKFF